MPESLNTSTGETQRWRLIPSRGNPGSSTVEGTQRQADEFGRALSELYGSQILVTLLGNNGIPTNHHYVGHNPAKNPKPKEPTNMGTTRMTPPERTTNGEQGNVTTDIASAKSLSPEQKTQLETARKAHAANGNGKSTKEKAAKAKAAPKVKAERKIRVADLGQALTTIRRPLKSLPPEQHALATSVRKELTAAWKAISSNDAAGYVSSVTAARKIAQGEKLADVVKAADAALKLAGQFQQQS